MKNLTPELIAKAKAAKSAEELLALAKENGVDLTEDESKTCFEQLHANTEISDDELEAVSGGGICQDILDFFRGRDEHGDSTCPNCGNKTNPSTTPSTIPSVTPDKPAFDNGITLLPYDTIPGDSNDKNKILLL